MPSQKEKTWEAVSLGTYKHMATLRDSYKSGKEGSRHGSRIPYMTCNGLVFDEVLCGPGLCFQSAESIASEEEGEEGQPVLLCMCQRMMVAINQSS